MHERPDLGRTIVEKFEEEARGVDLVFVLLTPDDKGGPKRGSNKLKIRGRQNVIFELGYFLGALRRRSGSVVLLKHGELEIPSDISGLVYIDISKGISSASREIYLELIAAAARPKISTSAFFPTP